MPMAEVEQFSYGVTNPILASVMAYVGCLLGLACTAHARTLPVGRRRAGWLLAGSVAIGGGGIWLMHMMAMLGFEVEGTTMRFNPWVILGSLAIAIVVVAGGIFLVGYGRRSVPRLLVGGLLTGLGVSGQHLTGMAAVHINGSFGFDPRFLVASIAISVTASTTALWFTLAARRGLHFLAAAAVLAVAVTGMHYTAMMALRIHVNDMPHKVLGVEPTTFVLPILLMSIAALVCLLFCALNIMGEDEFALRVDPAVLAGSAPPAPRTPTDLAVGSRRPPLSQPPLSQPPLSQPPLSRPPARALSLSTREMRMVGSHREHARADEIDSAARSDVIGRADNTGSANVGSDNTGSANVGSANVGSANAGSAQANRAGR
jgi:NO-binding membrane sensor protein with MHYT domain